MPRWRASSTLLGAYVSPLSHIVPESGLWKPQRILISVDLPAPLSPSSPSTSPLRRCRLMSRSALIGPNDFLTCSTRSTSSWAVCGPTIRSWGTETSATARPRSHPGDVRVERHRDQDRDTEVEV